MSLPSQCDIKGEILVNIQPKIHILPTTIKLRFHFWEDQIMLWDDTHIPVHGIIQWHVEHLEIHHPALEKKSEWFHFNKIDLVFYRYEER